MQLPDGYTARHPTMADAVAVTGLVNAAEVEDIGEIFLHISDIETDWTTPLIDISQDVLLIHRGEQLVAWLQVCEERADADVHPSARGQGLGTALIEWSEQRALARGVPDRAVLIGQTIPDTQDDAQSLFERRGYQRRWESWILRVPPGAQLRPGPTPPELDIRPFRVDEEHDIYQIIDNAFSEWESRESRPFEDWQNSVTDASDFDPSLLLVATIDGELAGAAYGIHYPGDGWIDQVAVKPEFRRRGIAGALIIALFSEFTNRGEQRMGLNTDSRTGALGLYLALGMTVDRTFVRWSTQLREAQVSSG